MLNTVSTTYQATATQPLYKAISQTSSQKINGTAHDELSAISISDQAQALLRIDEIDTELSAIFGTPKSLNAHEQRELNNLMMEMDKIYMKDQADEVTRLYTQMDALYEDGSLSIEEEQMLTTLEHDLATLMHTSTYELSDEDEASLASINAKIDRLYGTTEPSTLELAKAESLMREKEERFTSLFEFEQLNRFYQV